MFNWNFTTVSSVFKSLCRVGRDHRTKAMARSSVSPGEELELGGLRRRPPQSTHPIPEKVRRAEHAHPWGRGAPKPLTPSYPKARISPGREPGATKRGTGGHEKLPARLSPREHDRKIKVTGDDLPAPRTPGPRAGMAWGRQLVC